MAFQPSDDRVLLKPVPPESKTRTGLFIPENAQKITFWEVEKVGPHIANKIVLVGDKISIVQNPDVKIKEGMIVVIPESAGIEIEIDGQPRKVIRHSSIELYDEKE